MSVLTKCVLTHASWPDQLASWPAKHPQLETEATLAKINFSVGSKINFCQTKLNVEEEDCLYTSRTFSPMTGRICLTLSIIIFYGGNQIQAMNLNVQLFKYHVYFTSKTMI